MVALFQNMDFFGGFGHGGQDSQWGQKMTSTRCWTIVLVFADQNEQFWFGRPLPALGEIRCAQSFGVNVNHYKVLAFIIGTAIAGLTGGIYAHRMTFIFSSNFAFVISISIISMVVVGGVGTIRGPLIGAILLGAAPEVLRFAQDYRMILYGGVIVLMMRFQPQGLLGEDSFLQRKFNQYISPMLNKKGGESHA